MNSASKDVADFLAAANPSLGLTAMTNLFYARMPDAPSVLVAVYDNPGEPPMLTLDKASSSYFYSSISVRVRDNGYAEGWAKLFQITQYLHGMSGLTTADNSTYYTLIKAMNDPQVLFWDKNNRVIFFTNFDVQRKPLI